jgi:mannose-6-phosphate isomerase
MPPGPIALTANQPQRFYRGGAGIARFRGTQPLGPDRPEDFVGSTTEVFGGGGEGLTVLDDGRTLRDVIEADPESFLGPDHVAAYGSDTGLLVKILDTGERLLAHFHPDAEFARRHLNCRHGKSEAWLIVDVAEATGDDSAGHVYFGFTADMDEQVIGEWVAKQDTGAILKAMNKIPVGPGDVFFVPAGIPHAIGTGVMMVELQEPTDLSIFLEWQGSGLDGQADGHLNLGFGVALRALDRQAWTAERLAGVRAPGRWRPDPAPPGSVRIRELLPAPARSFFRAEHIGVTGSRLDLAPGFAILIVLEGEGRLDTGAGSLELRRGTTALVPYGAGGAQLTGRLSLLRCLPPKP